MSGLRDSVLSVYDNLKEQIDRGNIIDATVNDAYIVGDEYFIDISVKYNNPVEYIYIKDINTLVYKASLKG